MTTINTTADAVAAAAQYRASMAKAARLAARDAAGSPANVVANGFTVQGSSGPVGLRFTSAGVYYVFLAEFVAGS